MNLYIRLAEVGDASLIHEVMIKAFLEYKNEIPPSSALYETIESITDALQKEDEQAAICYKDSKPVGLVRFKFKENGVYFYRLSVLPEKQGKGIAKAILNWLEGYAIKNSKPSIFCKVRLTIPRNIKLYNSLGYYIYAEEVVNKPNGIKIRVVSMKKQLGKEL
ncbi:GNAT family N-acetyltransferase [Ammoniphilus sp. 3BR4]|uniref:GNAT family N-acetyltransferase n=1 Tax=Ammoniphilus sp. 3BR4 TaxID=3158265 RepID=UPI003465C0F2